MNGVRDGAFAGAAKNLEEFVHAFFGVAAFRLPLTPALPFPSLVMPPFLNFLKKTGIVLVGRRTVGGGDFAAGIFSRNRGGMRELVGIFFPPPFFADFFFGDLIGLVLEPTTRYMKMAMNPMSRAVSVDSACSRNSIAATGWGGLRGLSLAGSPTTATAVRLLHLMHLWASLTEALGRQKEKNEEARQKVVEHSFFAFFAAFMQKNASVRFLRLLMAWVLDPGRDCAMELVEGGMVFACPGSGR